MKITHIQQVMCVSALCLQTIDALILMVPKGSWPRDKDTEGAGGQGEAKDNPVHAR